MRDLSGLFVSDRNYRHLNRHDAALPAYDRAYALLAPAAHDVLEQDPQCVGQALDVVEAADAEDLVRAPACGQT